MARLMCLSEVSAAKTERETARQKPDHSPPPGARLDSNGGPPPKDRSLYEWYSWHMERAEHPDRLRLLTYLAERDYEVQVHGMPASEISGRAARQGDKAEAERVIAFYEGVDIIEVAVLERVSPGWVDRVRRQAKRDPKTGAHASGWHTLTTEQKIEAIARLRDRGYSQAAVSRKLEVSRRTIQRYWDVKVVPSGDTRYDAHLRSVA